MGKKSSPARSQNWKTVSIRMGDLKDLDFIKAAAASLGVGYTSFIRDAAIEAAREVNNKISHPCMGSKILLQEVK